jgi:hypothetical protein
MPRAFGIVGVPKRGGWPLVKPPLGSVIDHIHPLAQGLDSAYLFRSAYSSSVSGRDVLNDVSGAIVVTAFGVTASDYLSGMKSNRTRPNPENHSRLVTAITGDTFSAGLELMFGDITGMGVYCSSTAYAFLGSSNLFNIGNKVVGATQVVGYSHSNNPASTVTYLDGFQTNSSTGMGTAVKAEKDSFGYPNDSGFKAFPGVLVSAFTWTRILNAGEFEMVSRNPYQMFWTPGKRSFFFAPTSAPPSSYVAQHPTVHGFGF